MLWLVDIWWDCQAKIGEGLDLYVLFDVNLDILKVFDIIGCVGELIVQRSDIMTM